MNAKEEAKSSRYNKKILLFLSMFSLSVIYYIIILVIIYILSFLSMLSWESSTLFSCLYLYCFKSSKIFLRWTSLIDREVLLILKSKKEIIFYTWFNFTTWLLLGFSGGFDFANLAKSYDNRENLSRKQFLSLR